MKAMIANDQVRAFSSLQYAYREMFDGRLVAMSLSVLVASVLTFGILGPPGFEDGFGALQRLVFVASCGAICWPLAHALSAAILFLMRSRPPAQIALANTLGALFVTIPCSAVSYTLLGLFQSQNPVSRFAVGRLPERGGIGVGLHFPGPVRGMPARATEARHRGGS